METKLGANGIDLLEEQLSRWQELNEQQLVSPLRDALIRGDATLPKGALLHGTGMHNPYEVLRRWVL